MIPSSRPGLKIYIFLSETAMPKITITSPEGNSETFEVEPGVSVMEVARDGMMGVEGVCGGCLSCATCHVIVAPEWLELVGNFSDDENDMLDLTYNRTKTSRLGCQIEITNDLDGLSVIVPKQ
tara:strand:+ start:36934 stop:37302 length:369 start_codon:yes stop_codon:yes gene_type:complete